VPKVVNLPAIMFKEKLRWINTGFVPQDLLTMLPEGKVIVLRCEGRDIGFVRTKDVIHAFSSRCPHMQYSMEGGLCKDNLVVCPIHRYAFNIDDGRGEGLCLRIYNTEIRNGKFHVAIPYQTLWFL
jgi:nitrite reductase/ring-hydroxylating ferredoxin subunit